MTPADFEDIRYEVDGPTAVVTIARPERYNAFRGQTVEELIAAFRAAWADRSVRAIILTGEGDKAFCSGGDVKQRAETATTERPRAACGRSTTSTSSSATSPSR